MYGSCSRVEEARSVFDRIAHKNVYSWNIMLTAYAQSGYLREAQLLFDQTPDPGTVAWNVMIASFGQHGNVHQAKKFFDDMPVRDSASWNSMVAAYARNRHNREAILVFRRSCLEGAKHDHITFMNVIEACGNLKAVSEGKDIHMFITEGKYEQNVKVATALVNLYDKCGCMEDARSVFEKLVEKDMILWTAMVAMYARNGHLQEAEEMFQRMPVKDVVSWTAMLSAYAQNRRPRDAIRIFRWMDLEGIYPTSVTFITVLDACACIPSLALGRIIHFCIDYGDELEERLSLQSSLVHMYGRCGSAREARVVFESMKQRNVVSWSSIIAANAHNGKGEEALYMFHSMVLEGVAPVEITFISVLHACCHTGTSANAVQYFQSMCMDFEVLPVSDHYVCMLDVFGRSGQLDYAVDLISSMPYEPNEVAWTILLNACKLHSNVERAREIRDWILSLDGSWQYVLLSDIHAASDA